MKATKSTYLYIANYLFIFLVFISCQDKEDISPEREYPRIKTGFITKIDETGISVTGEILSLGKAPIREHGFIWSLKPRGEIHNSEIVSLGTIAKTGTYNTDINFALEKDKEYSIKAYAKTDQLTVYGQEIIFTSQGSLPPVILDFSPKTGTWGDTITVVGKNFVTPTVTEVKIGSQKVNVISFSATSFKFVIPVTVVKESNLIEISAYGFEDISEQPFMLKMPKITSISRSNGWLGDTITINGEFLGPDPKGYSIYFNQTDAYRFFTAISTKKIKVIVPDGLNTITSDITLKSSHYTVKSPEQFTLNESKLYKVTPSQVKFSTPFTIEGKNLHPYMNEVSVGGAIKPYTFVPYSKYEKISVTLDKNTIIPNRTLDVTLKVLGRQVEGKGIITITDKWLRQTNGGIQSPNHLFGWKNKVYMLDSKISEFNPNSNTWVTLSVTPNPSKVKAASFVIDDKIYVGAGSSWEYNPYKDFWQYDLSSNQWVRLADFPSPTTLYTAGVSFNGQGYFVTGKGTENFWRYSPQEDKWEKLPDLPTRPYYVSDGKIHAFIKNDKIFVLRTQWYAAEFWEYDPKTSIWTQKNAPPQTLRAANLYGNEGPNLMPGTEGISFIGNSIKYDYNYIQDLWEEDFDFRQDFPNLIVNYGFFTKEFMYINVSNTYNNIGLYKTEK